MSQENNQINPTALIQAEIIVRLMANGQIQINGPLTNKMLIYGMLECAKDAVRELGIKAEQSIITPVTLMPKFGN